MVCLVAFKGAVGDAVFEVGAVIGHSGSDEDRAFARSGDVIAVAFDYSQSIAVLPPF